MTMDEDFQLPYGFAPDEALDGTQRTPEVQEVAGTIQVYLPGTDPKTVYEQIDTLPGTLATEDGTTFHGDRGMLYVGADGIELQADYADAVASDAVRDLAEYLAGDREELDLDVLDVALRPYDEEDDQHAPDDPFPSYTEDFTSPLDIGGAGPR